MPFDFAKTKTLVRRVVHTTFGVQAFYQDDALSKPEPITARYHTKIESLGDLDNQSYAELIQAIDRVVLNAEEARRINVKRGGTVVFTALGSGLGVALGSPLGGEGIGPPAFVLQTREPPDGPVDEVWNVTRKETK